MNKLNPHINIGCPVCQRTDDLSNLYGSFKLSEPKKVVKVSSIMASLKKSSKPRSTKVKTLFEW